MMTMIKNKPYDTAKRGKQLEKLAFDAWQAVAELHNQTEVSKRVKKALKKTLKQLDGLELRFAKW